MLPAIDTDALKYLLLLLQLLNAAGLVVLYLRKPGQDAMQAVTELGNEVGVLKARLEHTPTDAQLEELNGRISVALANITSVHEQLIATRSSLLRIEDWLRSNK